MAQSRTVFHQRDVVDVGHFRTADRLRRSHRNHVAKDRLAVVVDLFADSPRAAPRQLPWPAERWSRLINVGAPALPSSSLCAAYTVDPRGSAWRCRVAAVGDGHPRGGGACPSADRSSARPCPPSGRSFAPTCPCPIWGAPRETRWPSPMSTFLVFIGRDPTGCPSWRPCGFIGPASIEVVGSRRRLRSRKPVLMNTTAVRGPPLMASLQVGGWCARLLVHDPDLERVSAAAPRTSSTRLNSSQVKRPPSVGAVHLRLSRCRRSRCGGVTRRAVTPSPACEAVHGDQAG